MTSPSPRVPIALGSASSGTEEGRSFLQSRLALFGRWVLLISGGFYIVGLTVRPAVAIPEAVNPSFWPPELFRRPERRGAVRSPPAHDADSTVAMLGAGCSERVGRHHQCGVWRRRRRTGTRTPGRCRRRSRARLNAVRGRRQRPNIGGRHSARLRRNRERKVNLFIYSSSHLVIWHVNDQMTR